ncbi:MAG: hypothetical protein RLZZ444_2942, partial [Pseudomonadota bacterium]
MNTVLSGQRPNARLKTGGSARRGKLWVLGLCGAVSAATLNLAGCNQRATEPAVLSEPAKGEWGRHGFDLS